MRRGTRKRRGTVTSAGQNQRLEALEKLREVLRDGGGCSPDQVGELGSRRGGKGNGAGVGD